AWRWHIGTCRLPQPNLMRWQRNSNAPWTTSRSRCARRAKSWQPSPPTRMRSPRARPRPVSTAEASWVSSLHRSPARPWLGGTISRNKVGLHALRFLQNHDEPSVSHSTHGSFFRDPTRWAVYGLKLRRVKNAPPETNAHALSDRLVLSTYSNIFSRSN